MTALSIILFFLSLFMILFSIYIYKLDRDIFSNISIDDISTETENSLNIIIEKLFVFDILKIYMAKNDTLSTNELFDYVKKIFIYYKSITPKRKYECYNKKFNNEYDSFIIKCIYHKLMNIDLEFKMGNNKEKI